MLAAAYNATTDLPLSQYGMEYNPIAINEVMAYGFASAPQTNRFFIELVNTLTSPELGTVASAGLGGAPYTGAINASVLDLAGFQSNPAPPAPATPPATPWDGGCWDLILTDDLPQSRPDPVLGQLQPGGNYFGPLPLSTGTAGSLTQNTAATLPAPAGDPLLFPLPQSMPPQANANVGNLFLGYFGTPPLTPNNPGRALVLHDDRQPCHPGHGDRPVPTSLHTEQSVRPGDQQGNPDRTVPPGVIPPATVQAALNNPPTYPLTYPAAKILNGNGPPRNTGPYFWVCLRRPANPFAPVSATNPMIVVDAMRFPFIDSGGAVGAPGTNYMFSYQRLQPYRGGQAVPMAGVTGDVRSARTATASRSPCRPPRPQTSARPGASRSPGRTGFTTPWCAQRRWWYSGRREPRPAGPPAAPPSLVEPWDNFAFNDRDFTSVAELLLVPGCPPGLFTKQFAEFAPSAANVTNVFGQVTPLPNALTAAQLAALPLAPVAASRAPVQATASIPFNATPTTPLPPTSPLTWWTSSSTPRSRRLRCPRTRPSATGPGTAR